MNRAVAVRTSVPSTPQKSIMDVDYEKLLDLQVPQWVRVSPSGKQVVYSTSLFFNHKVGENGLSTIWLAETGKEKSARQLTSGLFKDQNPEWSPDGKSIAFLSDRAKPGKSNAIFQLYLQGGEAFPLTPTENERAIAQFGWSPDGKFIAFLSADEKTPQQKENEEKKNDVQVYGEDWEFDRLRLLHVSSKSTSTLVKRDAQVTRFAWKDDGTAIAFTAQQTPEVESPLDGATLEYVKLIDKKTVVVREAPSEMSLFGLCWVADSIFFVAGVTDGSVCTSYALYSVPSEGGKRKRLSGGVVDCVETIFNVGGRILMHALFGLEDQIRDVDGNILWSKKAMIKAWHATTSPSGGLIIAVVTSSASAPSEVFSVSASGKEDSASLRQLSQLGAGMDVPSPVVTSLSVKSSDSAVTLDGLFIAPSDGSKKPFPTVVIPHGGPYYRTTDAFMNGYGWTPCLLNSGYAVMYPNYRDGSSHGEKFAAYARRGMGTVDYDDVITMTQDCIEQGLIDSKRAIIAGWSQGGFLSYLSAVRNGTHGLGWQFKGAICGAGISDWDSMCINSDVPTIEAELCGIPPWCADRNNTCNRTGSAVWEMGEAGKAGRIPPVLILHGEADVRVPVNQAWAFQRGCKKWKVPCEMAVYPRENHAFVERMHFLDMFRRVKRFCDQHIS